MTRRALAAGMAATAVLAGAHLTGQAASADRGEQAGAVPNVPGTFTPAMIDDAKLEQLSRVDAALSRPARHPRSRSSRPPQTTGPRLSRIQGGPTDAQWARLRRCESGGDYRNHDAPYFGAYQFDLTTWASKEAGRGHGNPADASPAEQDYRARLLYKHRGWHPWPNCGRFLR